MASLFKEFQFSRATFERFEYFTATSCMAPETNVASRLAVVQSVETHQSGAELHCKSVKESYRKQQYIAGPS